MNTNVFKSDFIEIILLPKNNILFAKWSNKSLLHDEFKKSVEKVANITLEHKCKRLMVDATNFKYVASNDVLAWHDTEIVPKYAKAGVKKIAFIQPASFFTELSTKKIFEQEKAASEMKQQFFKTESDALAWLNEI